MMMEEHPKRKSTRMKAFDYATPTSYFLTICTHEKKCILVNQMHCVVMPNHVHILLTINAGEAERMETVPAIPTIIGTYKSRVS